MGKIKKLKGTDLIGGINNEDVYPITSTKAVFDEENTSLYTLLNTLASSVETVKETANNNTTSILQEVTRAKTVEKQLEDSIKKIEPYIKVVWNYDSNINTYIDSGIYNIKGVHLRKEDNLPLESINAEATFNANLIVLDSTINNLGGTDNGACITQILSISDRVGSEGNVYIRTGRGYIKTVNAITWDSWSVMQTTTNVGIIKDEQHNDGSGWIDGKGMNSLGKTGFYRGVYFDANESFFLIVIDSKQAANFGLTSLNWVTQIKYGLPINGGNATLKIRRGAPKFDDLDVPIEGEFDWGEWKDFGGDSIPTITWQGQNLNDYTNAGVYNIQGNRVNGDNIPISNEGIISARLTVLTSDDGAGNTVVTQVLTLNNNSGGEGNVYVRSSQKGSWKPWGKLQTNVEVGMVNTLDNLTDNGMYSGVLMADTGFDTFVLVVINNYAAAVPAGYGWYVSQLKYSLGLDGSVTVKTRRMDYTNTWTEWEELKGQGGSGSPYTGVLSDGDHLNISKVKEGDVYLCISTNVTIGTGDYSTPDDRLMPLYAAELLFFKDDFLIRGFEERGVGDGMYKVFRGDRNAAYISWKDALSIGDNIELGEGLENDNGKICVRFNPDKGLKTDNYSRLQVKVGTGLSFDDYGALSIKFYDDDSSFKNNRIVPITLGTYMDVLGDNVQNYYGIQLGTSLILTSEGIEVKLGEGLKRNDNGQITLDINYIKQQLNL